MITNVLLRKGNCGFVRCAWLHLAVRDQFNAEKSDSGKNAEQEYCGEVGRGSCGA